MIGFHPFLEVHIRLYLYTIFRNHAANIVISLLISKYRVKYLNIFSYCNKNVTEDAAISDTEAIVLYSPLYSQWLESLYMQGQVILLHKHCSM